MKKWFLLTFLLIVTICAGSVFLLFSPKSNINAYRLHIEQGQGMSAVSRTLQQDGIIYNRHAMLALAYALGVQNNLQEGTYHFDKPMSTWDIIHHLQREKADMVLVRIAEGHTFTNIQAALESHTDLNTTINPTESELLQMLAGDKSYTNMEGLLFPDSYHFAFGTKIDNIYRFAYQQMQRNLHQVWQTRQENLPYQNDYELLIMASIIEKETALAEDRALVSAVFINRLRQGMLLQTDPTVIYGMGEAYQGRIRKKDLQTDTPYNTYTRKGLPPTPIAAPSLASLQAAAHPADVDYLYFVSRQDGTGKSQFSKTLREHNAAVRKYILKR